LTIPPLQRPWSCLPEKNTIIFVLN
jgi:hypothetical protein